MSQTTTQRSGFWPKVIGIGIAVLLVGGVAVSAPAWWPRVQTWFAASSAQQSDQGHGHTHGDDPNDSRAKDAAGHEHDDLTSLHLSDQAVRNIGLKPMTVQLTTFVRPVTIPGIVVEQPGRSRLAVPAPMTGIVTKLHISEGEAVTAGQPLFELRLTHEELVQAQGEFLTSVERLDVISQELKRLQSATVDIGGESVSAIAGRTMLQQRYEQQTLMATLRAQRQRLLLHGLTEEQVGQIEQTHQLLQQMVVYAPDPRYTSEATSAPRLQVSHLTVKPGEHVDAGEAMCELSNHAELFIEGQAFAEDAEHLNQVIAERRPITAIDEQASQRKAVEGLQILYLSDEIAQDSRALPFYVRLPNEQVRDVQTPDGKHYIGWRFKPGQRLRLQVPVEQWNDQIVVPATAVVADGAEYYVFQQNADHWDRRPVHVVHQDARTMVIAADGSIFPGDTIAAVGAFDMQQALKAKSGSGADAHAGHSH